MRKTQFNFDEHVQLATDLDSIRTTVMMHVARLSKCYSKSSRQIKLVRTLQKTVDSLRCTMDDAFHCEYPGEHYRKPYYDWVHSPYYFPKNENRNNNDDAGKNNE